MNATKTEFKNRGQLFRGFGILLLLGGIFFGLLAPLEIYCFYLFGEGGEFHYRGFAFGSFMFGNITAQIICYYILAALFSLDQEVRTGRRKKYGIIYSIMKIYSRLFKQRSEKRGWSQIQIIPDQTISYRHFIIQIFP